MDSYTERHFKTWLDLKIRDDERAEVEKKIRKLVEEYPDLLQRLGWTEMRELAERR